MNWYERALDEGVVIFGDSQSIAQPQIGPTVMQVPMRIEANGTIYTIDWRQVVYTPETNSWTCVHEAISPDDAYARSGAVFPLFIKMMQAESLRYAQETQP